nr:cysteine-rich small domain-containing protein [uncultured Butyrivibrio sp.]
MKNSSRFFANKECEYYPCHKSDVDLNCLFCYCPLYNLNCPGDYTIIEKGDKKIKSCMDCTFPHNPDNYDTIMAILKKQ